MLDIFLTTLPIYLMVFVGFAAVRTGYIDGAFVPGLSQFVLKVALIALIVKAIAFPQGEQGLNGAFFAAYLGGSLLTMILGYAAVRVILRQPNKDGWILAMGMSNSNSGFLGFPIGSLFFGPDAAVVFAMTMTIENAVTLPVPTVAAGATGHSGQMATLIRKAAVNIVKNPLIIAVVVSLAVRFSGFDPGEPVTRSVSMMAAAASPVALFAIGGTMAKMSVSGHWRRTAAIAIGKLVLHPVMVAMALFLTPGVPPNLIPVGILFAAVPMLTIYPILSASFGLGEVTSTALVVSTIASLFTLSIVLSLVSAI